MIRQLSKPSLPVVLFAESLLAVIFLTTAWGCGSRGTIDISAGLDEDQKAVQSLIYTVADSANDLQQFRALYAEGKEPSSADVSKFKGYVYFPRGDIVVSGTTATVLVGIEKQEGEAEPVLVEKQWTFVKEGNDWKMSDTPLP